MLLDLFHNTGKEKGGRGVTFHPETVDSTFQNIYCTVDYWVFYEKN